MEHFLFLTLILTYINSILGQDNSTDPVCYLTGYPKFDPFPSLTRCYKYNQDACCTSVHDEYIKAFMGSLLTSACERKYGELEDLFCYGCNPRESTFTNLKDNSINLCLSFALKIWNATLPEELNKPTTRFDNCGFWIANDLLKEISRGRPYIIPSDGIKNFTDFMTRVGIPLFDGFTYNIIDDSDPNFGLSATGPKCFGNGEFLRYSFFYIILSIFIFIF